jgi:tRNA U38,U39,U40 pseudouridine synthase TruA
MYREYKYFFLRENMDLSLIKQACKRYVGMHDFRNFCKKDEGAKVGFDTGEDQDDAS